MYNKKQNLTGGQAGRKPTLHTGGGTTPRLGFLLGFIVIQQDQDPKTETTNFLFGVWTWAVGGLS
jgi:hypothetical protein